jgi:peptidoglycan/LPS O-acetylase OafA/YrhL
MRFLVNRFTIFLGKISYGLYLMHPFFIYRSEITLWAATLSDKPSLVIPIVAFMTLAATIPIAYLLYVAVEAPFIWLGRRLTRPKSLVAA